MDTLDAPLAARMVKFRNAVARGNAGDPGVVSVDVYIRVSGDVQSIIDAGVRRPSVHGATVYGRVRLSDVERLAALPGVERFGLQDTFSPSLDVSIPDARVPQIRDQPPNLKGSGVVVGVIDSGIDIFHHAFRKSNGDTRIIGLWDQTIEETDTAKHPPGQNYGKFFDEGAINQALNGETFESLDAEGHGTHVAGIAAGDGSQSGVSDGPNAADCHKANTFVGVAPEADLVIVKYKLTNQGALDGINFTFSMAQNRPAVVNMSFGTLSGARDGTSQWEQDLDTILLAAPTGHAVIAAAGNAADDGLHAGGVVPANGSLAFEFEVPPDDRFYSAAHIWYGTGTKPGDPLDGAAAARLKATVTAPTTPPGNSFEINVGDDIDNDPFLEGKFDAISRIDEGRQGRHLIVFRLIPRINGALTPGTWRVELEETAGAQTDVDMWFQNHKTWQQEDNISANANADLKVKVSRRQKSTDPANIVYTGAARLSVMVTAPDGSATTAVAADAGKVDEDAGDAHTIKFNNTVDATNTDPHQIQFSIHAKDNGRVAQGEWTITLEETGGAATDYTAKFPETRPNAEFARPGGGTPVLPVMPRFVDADANADRTIEMPASANTVIGVGAYVPGTDDLANFSARGPRVDGEQKPELAAPGVGITAAKSDAQDACCTSDCCEAFYTDRKGTSMAAPHVTGVVALMFERNNDLTFEEVRTALVASATGVPAGPAEGWGAGKLNAQGAVSHALVTGGGGGGGGGGGSIEVADESVFLTPRATWPLQVPTPGRIAELRETLAGSELGNAAAALISKHFDEFRRIVNSSRRAAVVWHRNHGPELLKIALSWPGDPRPFVPAVLHGKSVGAGVKRILEVVRPAATPELAADIDRYAAIAAALPGARLGDLPQGQGDG